MLSLQFGELPAFRGVVGKLIVGEDSPWNNVRSHIKSPFLVETSGASRRVLVISALQNSRIRLRARRHGQRDYFLAGGAAPRPAVAAAWSSSSSVGKRSKVRSTFLPSRFLSKKSIIAVQSSAVKAWPCFA